jgi:hypothetical protein
MMGVAAVLGLVSAALAARAWAGQRQAWRARRWAKTAGRVVASGVEATTVRVRVGTSVGRYRQAVRYAPEVIYVYTVAGAGYEGRRLGLGPRLLTSERVEAERAAARYPVGSEVTVYYDAEAPSEAALEAGTGAGTKVYWLMAAVTLGLAVIVIAVGLR